MKVFRTRKALERWRRSARGSIGFVPTMGALHEGHLSLVRRSKRENKTTVVSIFVNPTQFGPKDDLSKYPRPIVRDKKILRSMGVDILFLPKDPKELYPGSDGTWIEPRQNLQTILEGRYRPGHFRGVATVVLKLFLLVRPDRAYFGEKDFQQVKVIEAMIRDLFVPLKLVRCPTVREASGLAMSSRNAYLKKSEREEAAILGAVLKTASSRKDAIRKLKRAGFKLQYLEVCDENLERSKDNRGRWLVAGYFKGVRLIDNRLRKS